MKWDWFDQFAMTLMVALILVIVAGMAALVGAILWMLFELRVRLLSGRRGLGGCGRQEHQDVRQAEGSTLMTQWDNRRIWGAVSGLPAHLDGPVIRALAKRNGWTYEQAKAHVWLEADVRWLATNVKRENDDDGDD